MSLSEFPANIVENKKKKKWFILIVNFFYN